MQEGQLVQKGTQKSGGFRALELVSVLGAGA